MMNFEKRRAAAMEVLAAFILALSVGLPFGIWFAGWQP